MFSTHKRVIELTRVVKVILVNKKQYEHGVGYLHIPHKDGP